MYICSSDEKRWSVSATMTSPDGFGEHVTSCVTSYGGVTPESPPSERYRHYVQYKLFVDVYVISTLCVVGFVGNVLSFGVLCSNCPFRCASLDWLNDDAGEQVCSVDASQRLQQAGNGRGRRSCYAVTGTSAARPLPACCRRWPLSTPPTCSPASSFIQSRFAHLNVSQSAS